MIVLRCPCHQANRLTRRSRCPKRYLSPQTQKESPRPPCPIHFPSFSRPSRWLWDSFTGVPASDFPASQVPLPMLVRSLDLSPPISLSKSCSSFPPLTTVTILSTRASSNPTVHTPKPNVHHSPALTLLPSILCRLFHHLTSVHCRSLFPPWTIDPIPHCRRRAPATRVHGPPKTNSKIPADKKGSQSHGASGVCRRHPDNIA